MPMEGSAIRVEEYRRYDLTGLAELIASGAVTPGELHETARTAVEEVEAELNATADGPWDSPLAYDPEGRFRGAPFVVKDLVCHPADVPMRLGSRLTGSGLTAPEDTHLMHRFRRAGLATVALATTPELGFNASTEALVYGPSRNPWDVTRSTGGSSGGTAALVAAGALPAGHGSDGAGSIRIPAAACGLVGLKPSRGRVPAGPDAQEIVFGLAIEFALTRTVRDTAALLDAVHGPMPGDRVHVAAPTGPFAHEVGGDPGRLRIAVHTESWAGTEVHPDVRATVEHVADELTGLGHHVERATPEVDWEAVLDAHVTSWSVALADAVESIAQASGLEPSENTLEQVTLATYRQGREMPALDVARAISTMNRISRELGQFFTSWDVLLTPTVNTPALPLGTLDQNATDVGPADWLRRVLGVCSFAPLFNLTGTPAVSLPLGTAEAGLPVGTQLAAAMNEDATLLRVASQLETVLPWGERLPPVRSGSSPITDDAGGRTKR